MVSNTRSKTDYADRKAIVPPIKKSPSSPISQENRFIVLGDRSKVPSLPSPSRLPTLGSFRSTRSPQTFVQAAKTTSPTKSPQSSKLPLPGTPAESQYINKTISQFDCLFYIEPEWEAPYPAQVAKKAFPEEFHYFPEDITKKQLFYEFILVDTDSREISQFKIKKTKPRQLFPNAKFFMSFPLRIGNNQYTNAGLSLKPSPLLITTIMTIWQPGS